jgi:hypothetical protein
MGLSTVPEAIEDIKAGKFVIVVDDEDRENEGDLVMAAEKVTPDAINFMENNPLEEGQRSCLVRGTIRVWPANYRFLGYYGRSPKIDYIHFCVKYDGKLDEGLYHITGELIDMVGIDTRDMLLKIQTAQKV